MENKGTLYCEECWGKLSEDEKNGFIDFAINKYLLYYLHQKRIQASEITSKTGIEQIKELNNKIEELTKSFKETKEEITKAINTKNKYRKQVEQLTELNTNLSSSIKLAIATNKEGWEKAMLKLEEIISTLKAYEV